MSEKEKQHTPEPWTAMEKPPASFSDHGWRSLAMCGSKWMVAAPVSAVLQLEDGIVVGTNWDHEANARRIVACVNACEGMADPDYEIDKMRTELAAVTAGGIAADDALYHGNSVRHWYDKAHAYRDAAGDLHSVTKQRDALLAALQECDEYLRASTMETIGSGSILHQRMIGAIAAAT